MPDSHITLPSTVVLTNKAPPNIDPTDKDIFSFFAARIEEKTSGAPLPNAKRVTPAIVGDNFKALESEESAGEKY